MELSHPPTTKDPKLVWSQVYVVKSSANFLWIYFTVVSQIPGNMGVSISMLRSIFSTSTLLKGLQKGLVHNPKPGSQAVYFPISRTVIIRWVFFVMAQLTWWLISHEKSRYGQTPILNRYSKSSKIPILICWPSGNLTYLWKITIFNEVNQL
jgi:hypothetical protein